MSVQAEMPRYRSHREVHALRIVSVEITTEGVVFTFSEPGYAPSKPYSPDLVQRYKPVIGDYLVVYDDGYTSISPAKAFEEGYTRI